MGIWKLENGGNAKDGARVLSEWLGICRVAVGEVMGETFVKLIIAGCCCMRCGEGRTTWTGTEDANV